MINFYELKIALNEMSFENYQVDSTNIQAYQKCKTFALAFDGAIENYDYIISRIKANYQSFALVKIGMPSDALKTAYIKKLCNKMDVTFSDELIDDFLIGI